MNLEGYTTYLRYDQNRSGHTVAAYLRDLKDFITFHAGDAEHFIAAEVKGADVRAWMAHCSSCGNSPRTLRRKASSLSSFFRYLMLIGRLEASPVAMLKLPRFTPALPSFVKDKDLEILIAKENAHQEFLTSNASTDKEKVLAFIEMRDALVVEMLYSTGLRRGEAVALRDEDIDMRRMEMRVEGKGAKERRVPIAPALARRINEYRAIRNQLFHNSTPIFFRGRRGEAMNYQAIYSIVKKRLSGTATLHQSPHALRHSFATAMINHGADINTVKKFLGHANINTTQIYTHVSVAELKKNYNQAHPRAITKGGHHGN